MIVKLGDGGGIDRDGTPIGFLWSNSPIIHGDDVLVTDLSLDIETAISQLTGLAWRISWSGFCGPSVDRRLAR